MSELDLIENLCERCRCSVPYAIKVCSMCRESEPGGSVWTTNELEKALKRVAELEAGLEKVTVEWLEYKANVKVLEAECDAALKRVEELERLLRAWHEEGCGVIGVVGIAGPEEEVRRIVKRDGMSLRSSWHRSSWPPYGNGERFTDDDVPEEAGP